MRVLSGRYELLGPLGRGGMGTIYRARDRELARLVAVKMLPDDLVDRPESRKRFQREARTAAGLNHPNITMVFDMGRDGDGEQGQPYLVMEFVDGHNLSRVLAGGPVAPAWAAAIVAQVLEALEHSHGRGVVHRDVKPSNIMVTGRGPNPRVKVLDFGIAKMMGQSSTRLTATGVAVGTPSYLAPEQAEAREVDARTDLYSTGCVLYEMLTGRPPFVADHPSAVLIQHLTRPPAPPSELVPGLPPGWDAVVLRALAKKPSDRFADAPAMREEILALAARRPAAPPATRHDIAAPQDGRTARLPREHPL
ncbi:protein kinase domain-containing protein [Actinomadura kijaniata]|uniref:protein kinase domain-containing protein n=1 Tax=Actinomadura kijaniata TaxID=46161 RepID=UPI00082D0196|nr:protein kinase [Actinomadura kijaniata]